MAWLRRARGSVRLRVTFLAAGAFAVVLIAAALVLVRTLERALENDVRTASEAVLQRQADLVLSRGIPVGAERIAAAGGAAFNLPVLGTGQPSSGPVVLFVRDPSRLPSLGEPSGELAEDADVTFVADDLPVTDARTLGIEGRLDDYAVTSLRVGGLTLATAASLEEVRDTIATTQTMFWIVGPVLIALVAGLAWLLAGRALRPVHAVT